MPKSMVPDPGQFDGDRTKFEDQWREIQLFLQSNRITTTNNRITAVLACLRRSVADIYAQKKLNQIEDKEDIQDWEEFVRKIKITFSGKSKVVDAKWKIETFKQGKKHIANFIIKFDVLAMKAETNDIHVIFLLKENIQTDIIKTILRYLLIAAPETFRE